MDHLPTKTIVPFSSRPTMTLVMSLDFSIMKYGIKLMALNNEITSVVSCAKYIKII